MSDFRINADQRAAQWNDRVEVDQAWAQAERPEPKDVRINWRTNEYTLPPEALQDGAFTTVRGNKSARDTLIADIAQADVDFAVDRANPDLLIMRSKDPNGFAVAINSDVEFLETKDGLLNLKDIREDLADRQNAMREQLRDGLRDARMVSQQRDPVISGDEAAGTDNSEEGAESVPVPNEVRINWQSNEYKLPAEAMADGAETAVRGNRSARDTLVVDGDSADMQFTHDPNNPDYIIMQSKDPNGFKLRIKNDVEFLQMNNGTFELDNIRSRLDQQLAEAENLPMEEQMQSANEPKEVTQEGDQTGSAKNRGDVEGPTDDKDVPDPESPANEVRIDWRLNEYTLPKEAMEPGADTAVSGNRSARDTLIIPVNAADVEARIDLENPDYMLLRTKGPDGFQVRVKNDVEFLQLNDRTVSMSDLFQRYQRPEETTSTTDSTTTTSSSTTVTDNTASASASASTGPRVLTQDEMDLILRFMNGGPLPTEADLAAARERAQLRENLNRARMAAATS